MASHDMIDNRHEKFVDHINRFLQGTEEAKFAVGYFFLSGLGVGLARAVRCPHLTAKREELGFCHLGKAP